MWLELKCISIRRTCSVCIAWVNIRTLTVVVSRPIMSDADEMVVDNAVYRLPLVPEIYPAPSD